MTTEREAVTERVAVEEAEVTVTYDNSQAAPGEVNEQVEEEAAAEGLRVAAEREAAIEKVAVEKAEKQLMGESEIQAV